MLRVADSFQRLTRYEVIVREQRFDDYVGEYRKWWLGYSMSTLIINWSGSQSPRFALVNDPIIHFLWLFLKGRRGHPTRNIA